MLVHPGGSADRTFVAMKLADIPQSYRTRTDPNFDLGQILRCAHSQNTEIHALFVVCSNTKSFLTYSFFHLHLLYQPYLGLCQAQCVQLHQRQPMSAVAITACEVHAFNIVMSINKPPADAPSVMAEN